MLCLYQQPTGEVTLDRAGKVQTPRDWRSKPRRESVRQLLRHVTPVPEKWARAAEGMFSRPVSWKKQPLLREVVLVPMTPSGDGDTWTCRLDGSTLFSSHVGLECR